MATQSPKSASAVKKKPLSWDDLLTLGVLAREASWAGAGKALGLTRNTVIRRIQRLELALGEQLVEDRQGAIVLTARGSEVAATADEMGAVAQSIADGTPRAALDRDTVHGLVRITAPEGISAQLIAPALGALQREYPELRVDLVASSAVLSISHKQADVAVRLAQPADEQLIALRAGTLRYAMFGAQGGGQGLLGYDASGARFEETQTLSRMFHDRTPQVRSNSLQVQLEAILGGAGSGLLPEYMEQRHAGLRRLSDTVLEKQVWVVFHGRHRDTARVRAVTAWLQQLLLRSQGRDEAD